MMTSREVHTLENLRSDLRLIGIRSGADVIVHASLRSIGKVEGGYRNFLEALLKVIGPDGTIIAPTFYYDCIDPAQHSKPPVTEEELTKMRKRIKPFNMENTQSQEGALGDMIRLDPRGTRSNHPVKSWAAIGDRAIEFTQDVSLDDADGLESPIGRIYSRGNGQILLPGVDHNSNTSLHLAESLAGSPHYRQTSIRYKVADNEWSTFTGCGGCSAGFYKIRGLIDFTKYEISGKVGNSLSYLIEHRPFTDAARDALINKPWGILCDRPICAECNRARKLYNQPPIEEREYHLRHPWANPDD